MTTNEEIAEYLEGGAAALADGAVLWARADLGEVYSDGSVTACAYGACNYARNGVPQMYGGGVEDYPYGQELAGPLTALFVADNLVEYNDEHAETADDVIDALRRLAKEFRNTPSEGF